MQNGAGGSISITAAEGQNINNVNLETTGDTNLEPLKADKVTINTNGNLNGTGSSEPTISAGSATINATGNIGSTDKPFTTDVDQITASGKNVNISNDKDLEVISVIGTEDVNINAKGDVTAGNNNGNANISGNNVTVVSTGGIGDQNNPIKVNSGDSLNANGKSLDLTSDKDIKVGKIDIAGDVNIDTKGSIESAGIGSHISGHDVNLNAGGNIGTITDPVNVIATGDVTATSKVGTPYMRVRLIRPEEDDDNDDEWPEDEFIYPQLAAKKVVLPNNKVPRRRIASKLIEEIIEEDDEPEEAEEVAKVDDDKPNVKPAGDGKKDEKQTPEEDGMDMMMIILIGSLLLLLIAGIIVAVILNKKADEDNEKAAE